MKKIPLFPSPFQISPRILPKESEKNRLDYRLFSALEDGDLEEVKKLIGEEVDVNKIVSDSGNSPLHIACQNDHFELVKYLVQEKGANINFANKNGQTAIYFAWQNSNSKMEDFLLAQACEALEEAQSKLVNVNLESAKITQSATEITQSEKEITPLAANFRAKLSLSQKNADVEITNSPARRSLNVMAGMSLPASSKVAREIDPETREVQVAKASNSQEKYESPRESVCSSGAEQLGKRDSAQR